MSDDRSICCDSNHSQALAQRSFVYTNNDNAGFNTVSAFSVTTTGSLTEIPGSPFVTGGQGTFGSQYVASNLILVSPGRNLLYVINGGTSNISAFSIDPTAGSLTPVPGSPFSTGGSGIGTFSLAITPDSKLLFVADTNNPNLLVYSIASNGALTQLPNSPVFLPSSPQSIRVSPDGKYLAVSLPASRGVGMYALASDGSLSAIPGSSFSMGRGSTFRFASAIDINCSSNLLFLGAEANFTSVDVFTIAPGGILSLVPGSPFNSNTGDASNVVLLSPDDRLLFASNRHSDSISVFDIAPNGNLTLTPGSPVPIGGSATHPTGMATNREGTLLYVATLLNQVAVFHISINGNLIPVSGSPFNTGQSGRLISLAAYPPKACIEQPPDGFDLCVQDESNGSLVKIDSSTGDYQFTSCSALTLAGKGLLTAKGSVLTLQHYGPDRRVLAKVYRSVGKGTASIQSLPHGLTITIIDRDTRNNTCACVAR